MTHCMQDIVDNKKKCIMAWDICRTSRLMVSFKLEILRGSDTLCLLNIYRERKPLQWQQETIQAEKSKIAEHDTISICCCSICWTSTALRSFNLVLSFLVLQLQYQRQLFSLFNVLSFFDVEKKRLSFEFLIFLKL